MNIPYHTLPSFFFFEVKQCAKKQPTRFVFIPEQKLLYTDQEHYKDAHSVSHTHHFCYQVPS